MVLNPEQNRFTINQADDNSVCTITNLSYEEIPQPGGREEKVFILPSGVEVILQLVYIRITGTVTVTLEDGSTGSADFTVCERYYLCAPPGTDIVAQATDVSCHICTVMTTEEGTEIGVILRLCQDVQSTASVVVDIEAGFCNPREQQIEISCPDPVRPPQCPAVFGNDEVDTCEKKLPVLLTQPLQVNPQQEENLCIRTESVYDWIQTQVDAAVTVTIPPVFCLYEITELDGECGGLALGDVVCFPCETPCDEILQCSNGECTLLLSLTDAACTTCPPEAVSLPAGFACEVPVLSCVYEVTDVEGECGEIAVGNLICFPCDEPCDEILQCSNGTCTLTLNRTQEACLFCPPDAVSLPEGFSCFVPTCVYEVTTIQGECGGLAEGDIVCFPCDETCGETLICANDTCSIILQRTSEACIPCPPDAVPFPPGISCTLQGGRIFNVDQQTFYDLIPVAVADANDGDTLLVTPGEYPQTAELVIDKPLTIRGFSAALTDVAFPGVFTDETTISLEADNITLEGLSLSRTTSGVTGDETLLRIPARGVADYYSGITIRDSILTGGERTLIVNVEDFTLENNTLNHTGDEQSLEIRGTFGVTNIKDNSFLGGAVSRAAIRFQQDTPTDQFSGTFLIDDNTMERHSQFVLFATSAYTDVSIFVRRNAIDHQDRSGSSIIFLPNDFPEVDTILLEENDITNPNPNRLAVFVDYRFGGTTAPTADQIQVVRNRLDVALPWGTALDTVSPDAPVGFTTTGMMYGMDLNAFDLVDNEVVPPIPE
ncbi:hypothetical protein GLW00_12850 [Halobacillus litoralis]|uniref:Right handed beta helix domain-containing protein n=1 Tax=Halobacillus litoralis TaxID=45668 RepID=A0A845FD70_9BACI|nr:hypothetical protein [Halobacillus litoralis]MYL71748.1 hypothetical protein [Halobacillus litoralis]